MPTRTKIIVGIGAVVFIAVVVAVFLGRDLPTHRALKAALHERGCLDEAPVFTALPSPPAGFAAWDRKADAAWRVEGCGATHDAVVRKHREPTGRKGRHHRDVYEVVFWN